MWSDSSAFVASAALSESSVGRHALRGLVAAAMCITLERCRSSSGSVDVVVGVDEGLVAELAAQNLDGGWR